MKNKVCSICMHGDTRGPQTDGGLEIRPSGTIEILWPKEPPTTYMVGTYDRRVSMPSGTFLCYVYVYVYEILYDPW